MNYWDSKNTGYGKDLLHHSNQNTIIATDFTNILRNKIYKSRKNFDSNIPMDVIVKLDEIIKNKNKIIEFGCGTGEFVYLLQQEYNKINFVGTDFSKKSIDYASKKYSNELLKYFNFDMLKDNFNNLEYFDISLCSNCLEHFKNPFIIINKILSMSDYLIILVPFNQEPMTDGYDTEGGAGHVFKFVNNTFVDYNIILEFKFYTDGWLCGINPLQWCVVIKK